MGDNSAPAVGVLVGAAGEAFSRVGVASGGRGVEVGLLAISCDVGVVAAAIGVLVAGGSVADGRSVLVVLLDRQAASSIGNRISTGAMRRNIQDNLPKPDRNPQNSRN